MEKTAIITPFGLFEYTMMSFGLRNSSRQFSTAYIDEIMVYSESEKQHKMHVHQVLTELNKAGLRINKDKCVFNQSSINFLGFQIS